MLILTIKTDQPEAELCLYEDSHQLACSAWPAHRQLAETIHIKLKELLAEQSKALKTVQAIAVYQGPGSFTGLRIGLSVANALADSLNIPIVGEVGADDWKQQAIERLLAGQNDKLVVPEYGAPPNITLPKK